MSLHRSLKTKPSALNQHRNVLTRAERISKLTESERFIREKTSPMGLPKVANRLVSTGKKPKKEAAEGEGEAGAAPGAAAAAPAAGKAPAGKAPAAKK
jgi:small basic protein (TIGR04137 family)